jgi:hypothetical protein
MRERRSDVPSGFIHKPQEIVKFVFIVTLGVFLVLAAAYEAMSEVRNKTVVIPLAPICWARLF